MLLSQHGPLAQLVEQRPFKAWVTGPNPVRLTPICLPRLVVRTSGFHPDNAGSIPAGDDRKYEPSWKDLKRVLFCRRIPSILEERNGKSPLFVLCLSWVRKDNNKRKWKSLVLQFSSRSPENRENEECPFVCRIWWRHSYNKSFSPDKGRLCDVHCGREWRETAAFQISSGMGCKHQASAVQYQKNKTLFPQKYGKQDFLGRSEYLHSPLTRIWWTRTLYPSKSRKDYPQCFPLFSSDWRGSQILRWGFHTVDYRSSKPYQLRYADSRIHIRPFLRFFFMR